MIAPSRLKRWGNDRLLSVLDHYTRVATYRGESLDMLERLIKEAERRGW